MVFYIDYLQTLRFHKSNDIHMSQIKIVNSPQTHILLLGCNGVELQDLSIISSGVSPNTYLLALVIVFPFAFLNLLHFIIHIWDTALIWLLCFKIWWWLVWNSIIFYLPIAYIKKYLINAHVIMVGLLKYFNKIT